MFHRVLILILVGFLGVRFEVGRRLLSVFNSLSKTSWNYARNLKFGT